jgi:prepilin-type N-terminal cleavage/methylation domain-containing protein
LRTKLLPGKEFIGVGDGWTGKLGGRMKTGKVTFRGVSRREDRGFSLLELLVTIAILGALVLLVSPAAGKIIRRANDVGAYSSIRQLLASARLQAVKRQANVVVLISLIAPKAPGDPQLIRFHTFQDRANDDTNPLPADEATAAGNFVQDPTFIKPNVGEPTLGEVTVSGVRLWKFGGTKDDLTEAAAFDKYTVAGVSDPSLTDRIGFTPAGGIVPPEDTSTSPLPTTSGGRGIYFADVNGRNFFRVTIDSDISGKLRIDKYVPGSGYMTTGWVWN